jgi:hypothetical protein
MSQDETRSAKDSDHPSPASSRSPSTSRHLPDVPGVSENSPQSTVATTSGHGSGLQLSPTSVPLPQDSELPPPPAADAPTPKVRPGDVLEALQHFTGSGPGELSFVVGDTFTVTEQDTTGSWYNVKRMRDGAVGVVPGVGSVIDYFVRFAFFFFVL